MISMIEALNYRSLRYIRQPIDNFHVLIGPNASGKTTFLDVVTFLGRLMTDGVEAAISKRTENFVDLLWMREGTRFELAIEAVLLESIRNEVGNEDMTTIRYEVAIGVIPESATEEVGILDERVSLKPTSPDDQIPRFHFPEIIQPPITIIRRNKTRWKLLFSRNQKGINSYVSEVDDSGISWSPPLKFGHPNFALSRLPFDEKRFPALTWFKELLRAYPRTLAAL